jgi:long-chain acyl-CoA synthetase
VQEGRLKKYWDKLPPDKGVFPLSELAKRGAEENGDHPVMRSWNGEDGYDEVTYNDLYQNVSAIGRWLIGQGVQPGDRIAVLGENRPEWGACYLGIQAAGAVVVPVDSMMPTAGIRHIISNSEARMVFVSQKFSSIIEEMRSVSTLETKICFEKVDFEGYKFLYDVISDGTHSDEVLPDRDMDELAAILYTSGTTGHSKGVMLTQKNIISNVASASRILSITNKDTFLSVLPIHHAFEATAGFLLPIYSGASITYSRSLKSAEIIQDIKNTNVTIMVGVPLLYEKMQQGMTRKLKQAGKDKLVNGMRGVVGAGKKVGLNLSKGLFKGLRTKAGLNTVQLFVSGGGPLDPVTASFFNSLGLKLIQGYGLSETSPVTHVNLPKRMRNVTVGPPVPNVEHKILDPNDQGVGEVAVKGPNVFIGYYNNEEATKAAFTDDGWFLTGDLGFVHPDGYLQVTGRAKNMLVTGGGKNVYPEEIEFYLNRNPFIAEGLVVGIPRKKGLGEEIAAMIFPDYEQIDLHFEEKGEKPTDADVYKLIKFEIKKSQKDLAEYKRIKTFQIVEEEFQKTSTKKIKRFLYGGQMTNVNGEKV